MILSIYVESAVKPQSINQSIFIWTL